ncbi:MAG: putative glucose-6-phosphate isomerase [Candidatus Roizmanbacteria bacterium GW2011_GWA2_37_7]|uniref:Glucose-6-phosphate isomerase n=1 Tax=Candidatus Roizmanbacteria bacterium GW2011_GWA2_37_7 TaxID=1618481 RepID=A0A0G0HK19_9BACT|nr:MAG: putative glucose-6-phosphate isomerase [Candidatus Roizmanbacteria bacterium GW2011_GWA2_37_7]
MQFYYKNTALIDSSSLSKYLSKLETYCVRLQNVVFGGGYDELEGSINLPSDENLFNDVCALVKKIETKTLQYIIVVGIGGSNLGTKAIYDALFGYYDVLDCERFPKIIFLDTQDPDVLMKIGRLIEKLSHKDQIVINAISKSGSTTETAANLEVVSSTLFHKFGNISDRFVFTTDEESNMYNIAKKIHIKTLVIPKKIGGRYSVLSSVGLFPLMLVGLDVIKLRQGAENVRKMCVNSSMLVNPSAISSALLYHYYLCGKNINDNFIFLPQLESLGKWYRQLMGESIGKNGKGITPTISIGSTDLHSVGQLYLGGPKDKITSFIYSQEVDQGISVPNNPRFGLVPEIEGKKIYEIINAIVSGTKIAYQKQKLPFVEIVLDGIREEEIGAFMQFKMIEMMYLAKLLKVNAFDQPHVELYKIETKKILEGRV